MVNKKYEKEFHDQFVTSKSLRVLESKFYSQVAMELEEKILFDFAGDLTGKNILFYGSGAHFSLLNKLCKKGAHVTAIDISPKTVEILNDAIGMNGLKDSAVAIVMDCENLILDNETFDVVIARSIIHHLNVEFALKEVKRVLKVRGKFFVIEPMGTNVFINFYRWLTPKSRTLDEQPFKRKHIKMFTDYFPYSNIRFLYFISIFAYIQRLFLGDRWFRQSFLLLHWIDQRLIIKIPFAQYLFWDVLLLCIKDDN